MTELIVEDAVTLARLTGRVVLVLIAHADDLPLFCGGLAAMATGAGAEVVVVRATNDDTDSVRHSKSDTIRRNRREFEQSCAVLGVTTIVDLDYASDHLSAFPLVELREHMIRLFRNHRPYAAVTFDPYSVLYEDNQDHLQVARAVDEACWTSMFDKHHPEHFEHGLRPHGVVERWYFGRRLLEPTTAVDISSVVEMKGSAAAKHRTMLGHLIHQVSLMAQTAEIDLPDLAGLIRDPSALVGDWVRQSAAATGVSVGLEAAELYRVVEFAGMRPVLDALTQ